MAPERLGKEGSARNCYRARPLSERRRFARRLFDGDRAAPGGARLTDVDWAKSGRGE